MQMSMFSRAGLVLSSLTLALLVGCDSGTTTTPNTTTPANGATTPANGSTATNSDQTSNTPASGTALTPANASIGFVGTHVGKTPDPDARVGNFQKFTGNVSVDAAAKSVKALSFEIDVASLSTGMEKLDDHLRNEDFFDVRTHPDAKFVMTALNPAEGNADATHLLVADLTMMGTTKSVTIPVKAEFAGDLGVKLSGETKIKRSEFGMGKLTDKVDDEVTVKLSVGK